MEIDTLLRLRTQIDEIDNQIVTFLRERVGVVKKVGELKKETSASQSFIRAGREAKMLRDLIKKASGVFPPQAIATMWRMVISTSLSIEQEMAIYTYTGKDNSCFWLAREYFGTFLKIHQKDDADKLISIVAKTPSAIGVLPLIDNSKNPWWVRPQAEANDMYVFARIPFIEEADSLVPPVLAIANTMPEATDDDVSLFSVTTNAGKSKLQEVFLGQGLKANILSTSGNNNFLLEINRFVPVGEIVICPGDDRSAATNFTTDFDASSSIGNNGGNLRVSYFVGKDADETLPQMILSGDRAIGSSSTVAAYGYSPDAANGGAAVSFGTNTTVAPLSTPCGWTAKMHQNQGNIALADGSVQGCTSSGLVSYFAHTADSSTVLNVILFP